MLEALDLQKIFNPETPFIEIVIRGSLTYLALFLVLRVILKRQSGTVGISDLLVIVLLADAAQNAMAGQYSSLSDGLILVVTIVTTSYFLDWLGYRFPLFEHLVYPGPLVLVKNGRMLHHNMQKELITHGELMSQLRAQGIEKLEEVKSASMEGDGTLSVIRISGEEPQKSQASERRKGG